MKCPHCKKSVNPRHPALCGKNPNRVKSPGRPKTPEAGGKVAEAASGGGLQEEAQPAVPVEPKPALSQERVPPPIQPEISVEAAGRDEKFMPDLSPESEPVQAPPIDASTLMPLTRAMVDTLCQVVDGSVATMVPKERPPGCPAMPDPVGEVERQTLTVAAAPVVAKWLPQLQDRPELVLLVVAGGIFAPRFLAARAVNQYCQSYRPAPVQVSQREVRPIADEELLRIGDRWAARAGAPA
jgi:hypothetical protein